MYKEYLENLILHLCKQPRSFEYISRNLNGLDPVQLTEELAELEKRKRIMHKDGLWIANDIRSKVSEVDLSAPIDKKILNEHIGFDLFKKPHPLDFEWRNTKQTVTYLTETISKLNSSSNNILLLGMPTLFAGVCHADLPQNVLLIENNKAVLHDIQRAIKGRSRFKVMDKDIFKVEPAKLETFDSVFMDPPWYSPHFYSFMWLASCVVEMGGIVGISLPPINTRPNIDKERMEWFSFCQKNGLCIENLYTQELQYAMPFFEFNAYRAAGVRDIQPFWRKGDFALFRKVSSNSTKQPKVEFGNSNWVEREINSVRIRIKVTGEKKNDAISIDHLVKGDILPSVSSRDKRRKSANMWTSGNRIFKVNNPDRFIKLLNRQRSGKFSNKEEKLISDFISTITDLEQKEYNNYIDWIYYEMERQTD